MGVIEVTFFSKMAPSTRNWHQKNAKIALFILWRKKRQFYISIFYCLQLVLHYKWYKLTLEVASICKKALPSSNFDVHDYPSNHSWLEVSHFSSNVSLKFVKISRPWRVHLRLQKPPKKVVQWVQIRSLPRTDLLLITLSSNWESKYCIFLFVTWLHLVAKLMLQETHHSIDEVLGAHDIVEGCGN